MCATVGMPPFRAGATSLDHSVEPRADALDQSDRSCGVRFAVSKQLDLERARAAPTRDRSRTTLAMPPIAGGSGPAMTTRIAVADAAACPGAASRSSIGGGRSGAREAASRLLMRPAAREARCRAA